MTAAALLLCAAGHAAVLADSYLGTRTEPRAAPDQVMTGRRVHLHLVLDRIQDPGPVTVAWFYRGRPVKRSVIAVSRKHHYSVCPILSPAGRRRTGEWTVLAWDHRARPRSHHFTIK